MRWIFVFLIWAAPAAAVTCEDITYNENNYTICEVNPGTEALRLYLNDANDKPYGSFQNVETTLDVETLSFGMNAGMYHQDRAPVGYYVEHGDEIAGIVPNEGPGNFGLLPNGIFCIHAGTARVYETLAFIEKTPRCTFATQSGPMLVIDGKMHPKFTQRSASRFIRNGVGTSADGTRVVFAISNEPVNFWSFGSLFRDHLGLPNALYFDGKVSRMHAPQLNRSDPGLPMGPIIAVID